MTAEADYYQAKREYRAAGKAAMGKPAGSPAQKAYAAAKKKYHAAGEALRKQNKRR